MIAVSILLVVIALKVLTSVVLLGLSSTSVLQQQADRRRHQAHHERAATVQEARRGTDTTRSSFHPSLVSASPEPVPMHGGAHFLPLALTAPRVSRTSRRSFSLGNFSPLPEEGQAAAAAESKRVVGDDKPKSSNHLSAPNSAPMARGANSDRRTQWVPLDQPKALQTQSAASKKRRKGAEAQEKYADPETLNTLAATDRYALQGSRIPL